MQALINEFDKKIEQKFGAVTSKAISQAATDKFNRSSYNGQSFSDSQKREGVTMQTYNSIDTPEHTFAQKRVINRVNE